MILGLPGDTVDSVRRGLEYIERHRPFTDLQIFNLSVLPGTEFRRRAGDLGLEYQPRPPYYVLQTPTLGLEALYELMEEAQEAFGILMDPLPPVEISAGTSDGCVVDLDAPAANPLPPVSVPSLAFTLWLRSADFRARAADAAGLVRQVLADNPHTTLQVVLEPLGNPRQLGPQVLEDLLAAAHETPSYLDWFYKSAPGAAPRRETACGPASGSDEGGAGRRLARRN